MFDLCVIGGGIYGCGVAQAAAANGLSVLLVEKEELASGTSSQSTKLIHGGLRYLEQGRLKLVYEALAEREILLRIAPGLVERVWVHIPVYASSRRSRAWVGAGLALYWLLSAGRSPMRGFAPERSPVPALRREGLRWVWAYTDASTDDARLVSAVAENARRFGCEIRTHCALERAEAHKGRWKIALGDGSCVEARVLVNAAGAWIPEVAWRIAPAPPSPPVRLVQGSHLWLERPMEAFVYLESLDGRVMFVRPWRGRTLVGTTETEFSG
ncbi:MAG: FAD-dependent oxidoreductase, partial [Zetaproteobacteria bacterium]